MGGREFGSDSLGTLSFGDLIFHESDGVHGGRPRYVYRRL